MKPGKLYDKVKYKNRQHAVNICTSKVFYEENIKVLANIYQTSVSDLFVTLVMDEMERRGLK